MTGAMTFSADDARHLARALQLAEQGIYTTDPNPRVGCVLVRDGAVVGEGAHLYAGEPHAEVHAVRSAGARARGATAYVTLEPCCHTGRTPPCTDALIDAGVARVVAAMQDPNPKVSGGGARRLEERGIRVELGLLAAQAERLNPGFVARMRRGRPYVRSKIAASLDGRTALANGASQWITGEAARTDVQRYRARSSAVLTGIGTVLADDPLLNVRAFPLARQPTRIVIDSRLRIPAHAKLLALPGKTWIACAAPAGERAAAFAAAGAEILKLPNGRHEVDLSTLMQELARREINEILVEAGARLNGALLQQGLIDELVIYFAPHLLGADARGMFALTPLQSMTERVDLEIVDVRAVGVDWRMVANVKPVRESGASLGA